MTQLALPDGRQLEYEVSGPDGALPLVWHHGTPSAAHQFAAVARAAHERGLRLVTFSRPGYGSSDRQPGRRVVDVVPDVEALLDELRADQCVVAGWSGGGPHALATAARLPERAAGVLSIAGVAPFDADGLDFLAGMGQDNLDEFGAAREGEQALRAYLDAAAAEVREATPDQIAASMGTLLPEVDRAVMTDEFGADLSASFRAALRTGVDGWLDDDLAFVTPWGFDLIDISVPCFVWQGSADLMVPFDHGAWLASHLPGADAHLLEGEGHLSVVLGRMPEMLDELVAVAR